MKFCPFMSNSEKEVPCKQDCMLFHVEDCVINVAAEKIYRLNNKLDDDVVFELHKIRKIMEDE